MTAETGSPLQVLFRAGRLNLLEELVLQDAHSVQVPLPEGFERVERVDRRTGEIDARGFVEVAHRHGQVADLEAVMHALNQELRIKDEVVAVAFKGHGFENFAGVGSESRMPLTEVLSRQDILDQS
ncbi:MAG: hypothetical protein ACI87A_002927 [Planctomycetota bacterium]